MIGHRNKWKWDDEWGFLIFVPPPLSSICLFIFPLFFVVPRKIRVRLNFLICYVLYIVVYGVALSLIMLFYNIALTPIAYFKGFFGLRNLIVKNTLINIFLWIHCGFFILIFLAFRDTAKTVKIMIYSVAISK